MSATVLPIHALYLIDGRISLADRARLIADLPADGAWAVLDDAHDGLGQIREMVANYSGLGSLHLIGYGSPGSLLLGSSDINLAVMQQHAADLAQIGSHLMPGGDILIYGCNVAQGEVGQATIEQLARLTGTDVAASTNPTGVQGDWSLEATTGTIQTQALNVQGFETTLDTVGINSLSTPNRKPTLSGSIALGSGRTLEIELGGKIYTVGPQLTISGNTWTLNLGTEISDLSVGSHDVKAQIVDAKPAAPVSVSLTASNSNAVNLISSTSGDDTISGRADTRSDIAVFSGNRSAYTITATASGITVSGPQGTDRLTNLNQIKFADSAAPEFVLAAAARQALTGTNQVTLASGTVVNGIDVTASKLYNGTKAAETFVVAKNISAMILAGADDTVDLSGRITDYTYTAKGTQLQINDGTYTTTVNVGGSLTLRTASGSYAVSCAYSGGIPGISIGGQTVNGSFNAANATSSAATISGNAETVVSTLEASALVISNGSGDVTAPTVTAVTDATTATVTNAPITFTVTFSEALATDATSSNFTASNGAVTSVTKVDATHYTVVVAPATGVATGNVALSLVGGGLKDAAGNAVLDASLASFDSQAISTAGLATPVITAASSDGYKVVGTATPNSTVTVIKSGTPDVVLGTTTADASGAFFYVPTTPLATGTVVLKAQASDAAGNTSAVSASANVTVAAYAALSSLNAAQVAGYTDAQIQLMSVADAGATQFGATTKDGHLLTQALSAAQVAVLSWSQFSSLTLPQYQALNGAGLTATQINIWGISTTQANPYGVTSRWVSDFLTNDQISALSLATVSGLNFGYTPLPTSTQFALLNQDQVQALTQSQVIYIFSYSAGKSGLNASYLTTAQISGLTGSQIVNLSNAQLAQVQPNLTTSQIAGLSAAQLLQALPNLTSSQIGGLSYTQIKTLSAAQVQSLNGAGLTSSQLGGCVDADNVSISSLLTNTQMSALTTETVQSIDFRFTSFLPAQIAQLTQSQTQVLTQTQLQNIRAYTPNNFSALNAANFTASQLAYNYSTNVLLISKFSNAQVASLTSLQIATLSDAATQALNGAGLTVSQLSYTNAASHTVLGLLTPAQVGAMSASMVAQLLPSLSTNQLAGLTSLQFASFTTAQIQSLNAAGLTENQITNYKGTDGHYVYELLNHAQMQALPVATISALDTNIMMFSADQVAQLSQAQVQAWDQYQLWNMRTWYPEVLNALNASYFTAAQLGLDFTTLGFASTDQYGGHYTLLRKLSVAQIAQLTSAQFALITPANFKTILSTKGFGPEDMTATLSDGTTIMSNLTNNQLMDLSAAVVKTLPSNIIATLTAAQLGKFNAYGFTAAQLDCVDSAGKKVLEDLTTTQLTELSADTVAGMTSSQFATLTDAQVGLLNAAGLNSTNLGWTDKSGQGHTILSALTTMQVASLSAKQISQFTSTQIKALSSDQLKGFSAQSLGYTDASGNTVLNELSATQLSGLSASAISGMSPSQLTTVATAVNQQYGVSATYKYADVKAYLLNNIASLIAPTAEWQTILDYNSTRTSGSWNWSLSENFKNALTTYLASVKSADSTNAGLLKLLTDNFTSVWEFDPIQKVYALADCQTRFIQFINKVFAPSDAVIGQLASNPNYTVIANQLTDPNSYMSILQSLQTLQDTIDGGGVSEAQLTSLNSLYQSVASVKGVSSYEASILEHIVANAYVRQTQIGFQEQVNQWFLGTDNPSPKNGSYPNLTYRYQGDAALFPASGISTNAKNISQGALGDCYLVSSLIEMGLQTPDLIPSIISKNPNGTYAVRIYSTLTGIEYITLDGNLPHELVSATDGSIWATLLEKAYAQAVPLMWDGATINAYEAINGGWDGGIRAFTGNKTISINDTKVGSTMAFASLYQPGNTTYTTVKAALDAHKYVLFSSNFDGAAGTPNSWLVGDHMFAVVGTNPANGKFLIMNPWGGNAANNYGIHELDVADLAAQELTQPSSAYYDGFVIQGAPLFSSPLTVTSGQIAGLGFSGGTLSVSDGSANLAANIGVLHQNVARISNIAVSDSAAINLSAAQLVDNADVYPLVSSDVDVSGANLDVMLSSTASAVQFEAVSGWGVGDRLVYASSALAPLANKVATVAGTASVTDAVASFNVADDTLGEMINAAESAINSLSTAAGAYVKWAYQGSAYVFISDGLASGAEHDTLVKLINVSDVSRIAYDSVSHAIIGG
jgi:hypothetical protein